jgi:hypothetical protein
MKNPKFAGANFFRISSLAAIGWTFILHASLVTAEPVGPVDPPMVDDSLAPSHFIVVAKTVQTPDIPPRPDIVFLADTTGSMTDALAAVQGGAAGIMSDVDAGTAGTPFFAAAEYRDFGGSFAFALNIGLTADQVAVNTAIGTWNADEGGDTPEAQLNALNELATGAVSFREDSTPVIVWFGDASGHDPSGGVTEAAATAALVAPETIAVIAIDVNTGFGDGLNATGQAARIATATGGQFFLSATPEEIADTILEGLSNLPITVIPIALGCDPLVVTFAPASMTVTSGDPVNFVETIAVPNDSVHAGQTVHCTVEFRDDDGNVLVVDDEEAIQDIWVDIPLAIDLSPDTATNELSEDNAHTVTAHVTSLDVDLEGKTVDFEVSGTNAATADPGSGTGTSPTDANGEATFSYDVPTSCDSLGTDTITGCTDRADGGEECDDVTKDWVDTIAPVAECVATVNPHGNNVPPAPGEGGQGQNQDGFYELLAEDNLVEGCDPLQLIITDDGSGTVFGPFLVGTKIKYVQDPDAVPESHAMGGNNGGGSGNSNAVDWFIKGTGDAVLTAVDQSGNVSDPVSCLVPPPPQ